MSERQQATSGGMSDTRPEPPTSGDERATVVGFIDFLRATVALKTADLTDAQLAATLPPSSMTLGGMLHHLAFVEDHWFWHVVAGRPRHAPFDAVDWRADPDWDWHVATDLTGDEIRDRWAAAVARSREVLDAHPDLEATFRGPHGDVSLRWVLVHLVEEYGRHAGHVDLLRESIDGLVGE